MEWRYSSALHAEKLASRIIRFTPRREGLKVPLPVWTLWTGDNNVPLLGIELRPVGIQTELCSSYIWELPGSDLGRGTNMTEVFAPRPECWDSDFK